MAKLRLTKNELKLQKDRLKRFNRYLPTLVLKMQQLKLVLNRVELKIARKREERERYLKEQLAWQALFGEQLHLEQYVSIRDVTTVSDNIAGVMAPNFICINFDDVRWDIFALPPWADSGIRHLKHVVSLDAELQVLQRQCDLIAAELLTTTQRVNLFERIMIPQTKDNIRRITIYLGDQQTAAVVRGKIAKRNLVADSVL